MRTKKRWNINSIERLLYLSFCTISLATQNYHIKEFAILVRFVSHKMHTNPKEKHGKWEAKQNCRAKTECKNQKEVTIKKSEYACRVSASNWWAGTAKTNQRWTNKTVSQWRSLIFHYFCDTNNGWCVVDVMKLMQKQKKTFSLVDSVFLSFSLIFMLLVISFFMFIFFFARVSLFFVDHLTCTWFFSKLRLVN